MIKEKSCGAVVFKVEDGKIYYLIEKMKKGHYSIPKGHVENKETEEQTALREIKEETSLNVWLDTRYKTRVTYSPYKGCMKDVIFFVAKALTKDPIPQEIEVSEIYWLELKDAVARLTYDSDKQVVIDSSKFIVENYL